MLTPCNTTCNTNPETPLEMLSHRIPRKEMYVPCPFAVHILPVSCRSAHFGSWSYRRSGNTRRLLYLLPPNSNVNEINQRHLNIHRHYGIRCISKSLCIFYMTTLNSFSHEYYLNNYRLKLFNFISNKINSLLHFYEANY